MADRHTSSSRTHASGVSKLRSGVPSSSSVRRNLFQNQVTRRPTALSPASDDLHSDEVAYKNSQRHGQFQTRPETSFPEDDIVVRDHNGEIELGDPPTPIIDDSEDMEAIEARHENELEKQRLAEAVKQHRIGQHSVPAQPEELLEAVKASLRAKVAALAEDDWLYEPGPRPQRHQ